MFVLPRHLPEAEVEGVHPEPEEDEVDDSDGDAKRRPRSEVDGRILPSIFNPESGEKGKTVSCISTLTSQNAALVTPE